MSFRLVIDGNAVYEIDEDCEKCGTKRVPVREKSRNGRCRLLPVWGRKQGKTGRTDKTR